MNSALYARANAIESLTPAADLTGKEGYLCKLSNGKPAVNDSATSAAYGVILDGEDTDGAAAIAVLGGNHGTIRLKAGAAITKGQELQQKNDGTVIPDAGAGNRVIVGRALEAAATDELFEAVVIYPVPRT